MPPLYAPAALLFPRWCRNASRGWATSTTFKVKGTGPLCSPPFWRVRRLQRWASEHVGRGKLLLRCRLLSHERHFGANVGEEDSGGCISWPLPAYSLCILTASVGRIVCGAKRSWGESSMGWNVYEAKSPYTVS